MPKASDAQHNVNVQVKLRYARCGQPQQAGRPTFSKVLRRWMSPRGVVEAAASEAALTAATAGAPCVAVVGTSSLWPLLIASRMSGARFVEVRALSAEKARFMAWSMAEFCRARARVLRSADVAVCRLQTQQLAVH